MEMLCNQQMQEVMFGIKMGKWHTSNGSCHERRKNLGGTEVLPGWVCWVTQAATCFAIST
jgi:hypothetical protein